MHHNVLSLVPKTYVHFIMQNVFTLSIRVANFAGKATPKSCLRLKANYLLWDPVKIKKKFQCFQQTMADSKHSPSQEDKEGYRMEWDPHKMDTEQGKH